MSLETTIQELTAELRLHREAFAGILPVLQAAAQAPAAVDHPVQQALAPKPAAKPAPAPAAKPAPAPAPAPTPVDPDIPDAAEPFNRDAALGGITNNLRDKLVALSGAGDTAGMEAAKASFAALRKEFGVEKIAELSDEQIPAFAAKAAAL